MWARGWPDLGSSLAGALAFGLVTLAAPWFILQPALGSGVMGRRLSNRRAVTALSVTTQLAFGAGLFIGLQATVLLI